MIAEEIKPLNTRAKTQKFNEKCLFVGVISWIFGLQTQFVVVSLPQKWRYPKWTFVYFDWGKAALGKMW